MPTAAGQGAIPSAPMPAAAAGQGAQQDYTAEQAANDIQDLMPPEQITAIVKRVVPRPAWYHSDFIFQSNLMTQPFNYVAPAVRQWLRDDRISPLRNPPPPLQMNLRGGRRRKTRTKRKHFRKRTSRRT